MVYLVAVEHHVLVYYCAALLPEVDLRIQPSPCIKNVWGRSVRHVEVFDA
jgi:hypothetical protein